MRKVSGCAVVLVLALTSACGKPTPASPTRVTSTADTSAFSRVPRPAFNAYALELGYPLFWSEDKNHNQSIDPDEVATVWGFGGAKESDYKGGAGFTEKFLAAYKAIEARHGEGPQKSSDPQEEKRRAAVRDELAQGRPTLVMTDLTKRADEDKIFVRHMLKVAEVIDRLYMKQMGTFELQAAVPAGDAASQVLFFRNQGPKCKGPKTQNVPECSALAQPSGRTSGLYAPEIVKENKFCEALTKSKTPKVMDPFTYVAGTVTAPKPVPYTEAFQADMLLVSKELAAAAQDLASPSEAALRDYLQAASKAFTDNNWVPADEAWAKMSVSNSKWYLRVAPDEVYDEPCSVKALFHLSLGRINQDSLTWQKKLDPLKSELERELATLAGPPYQARSVSFKLPDFVDIVINAGDSRDAFGGTIGQSLPNFGPVANEGRGRTIAVTNFYNDPDSMIAQREQAESLFCKPTMSSYAGDQEPMLMSTVLHEAAHNLGPAHQYKVGGKTDREAFGGPLASTMEELKAQTSALYFSDWLVGKNQVDKSLAEKAHVRDVLWAFGHISRGMYSDDGHPKNYSQLAAIHVGHLMGAGALTWKTDETAANGKDKGCFSLEKDKFAGAVQSLAKSVAGIKGRGDKVGAEKLVKEYVDVNGPKKAVHDVVTERMLRSPKASFFYAIRFD